MINIQLGIIYVWDLSQARVARVLFCTTLVRDRWHGSSLCHWKHPDTRQISRLKVHCTIVATKGLHSMWLNSQKNMMKNLSACSLIFSSSLRPYSMILKRLNISNLIKSWRILTQLSSKLIHLWSISCVTVRHPRESASISAFSLVYSRLLRVYSELLIVGELLYALKHCDIIVVRITLT
jgi:hypothetical protein